MAYKENTLLDYYTGSDYQLGVVVKDNDEKIHVQGTGQAMAKIARRVVLVAHANSFADRVTAIKTCQEKIDACLAEIDVPFVWEILCENAGEFSFEEICKNYFGDSSPIKISAMARALIADMERFQRVGNDVQKIKVRSKEEYAEILRMKAVRAERAALKEKTVAWLAAVIGFRGEGVCDVPEEFEQALKNIEDYLFNGTNTDTINLLSRVSVGRNIRENAIRILRATGRMPEDADEFLLINGIHAGFPKNVVEFTEQLSGEFNRAGRRIVNDELIFSIDDAETVEIDDALSCRRDGENYIVGVYIADPACYVHKGDLLDKQAEEHPLSLYLPTTTVQMFPPRLSRDLASLCKGVERPALAFTLTISEDGELLDWALAPSVVTVSRRMTYIEADDILENHPEDEAYQSLSDLLKLADIMKKYREEDGGVSLNRPELHVRVSEGDISVEYIDQNTPSHRMIAEFMVQANYIAAKYALRNDLPVIYRVQDPPSGDVVSLREYDPYIFDQNVRKMKRTRLSTYPQPHFGLGLDLYIQISSPLRRYADLVMHRQIAAHCMGDPIPYTQEELFVVLGNVESTSYQNKSLQREADEYWLLEYMRRYCVGKTARATVVRVEGNLILAELEFYCARGVLLCRERPLPGEHCNVEIKEVYPDSKRLILQRL